MSLQLQPSGHDEPVAHEWGSDAAQAAPVVLQAVEGETVTIPAGGFLLGADFSRSADDLVLSGAADEPVVVVRDYFSMAEPPPRREHRAGVMIQPFLPVFKPGRCGMRFP